MPAQPNDRLYVERLGIPGFATAKEIADLAKASDLAAGFVDVFAASQAAKQGNVAATLGVIQSPPFAGTGTGETPTPVKLAACQDTLLSINGSFVGGFSWGGTHEYAGAQGDLVESTGMVGAVINSTGNAEGAMPMNHLANASHQFHNYFFRGANPARFFPTCGPVADTIYLVGPNPTILPDGASTDTPVDSVELQPNQTAELNGTGSGEYYLYSKKRNLFFLSRYADNRQFDQMVVFPPATQLIGHCRNASVSVIYPDTTITLTTGSGNEFTFVVQPGVPFNVHTLTAATGESGRVSYDPLGAGKMVGDKPLSCISGADEAGLEITSWQSVETLGQQGALPLPILEQTGSDKVRSSLSFFSPYVGDISLWVPGASLDTPTWTGALVRHPSRTPATTPDDQNYPAGVRYAVDAANGFPDLPAGTRWRSTVPVYPVANYNDNADLTDTDETVLSSVTPETIRANFSLAEDGLRYRRSLAAGGVENWVLS